jgi:ribonuclease HI
MTDGRLLVYTDGASRSNPGPSAVGVFICTADFKKVDELSELLPDGTNNVAEYRAVLRGLFLAAKRTNGRVEVRTDSQLLVRQMKGEYRTKKPELAALREEVKAAEAAFAQVAYKWVPREEQGAQRADALANEALTAAGNPKSEWPGRGRR